MGYVTYGLIGISALVATLVVIQIVQSNSKEEEEAVKTTEIEEKNRLSGASFEVHNLNNSATLKGFEDRGLSLARDGVEHF